MIGHLAAAQPSLDYKGKHAGGSAHLKVGLHSGNMSLWTSEEKEKKKEGGGGGGGGAAAAKKTKEQQRRLRSSEED